MAEQILWSVSDGVARLTFNRPRQANSLGLESCADMRSILGKLRQTDARVVVITGEGEYFCAGGDIVEFQQNREHLDQLVDQVLEAAHPMLHALAQLPIPVISAVNGPLGGAGIGLALCADFVLAADTVKLRGGYCGIGLTPDLGTSYFLTRRVGAARAKEIFMLNRAYSAHDCLRLGIVDQVHPAPQLGAAVDALARELAAGPTASYGRVKSLCDRAFSHDLQTHLDLELKLLRQSARTTDSREGVAAFLDKRVPRFRGS